MKEQNMEAVASFIHEDREDDKLVHMDDLFEDSMGCSSDQFVEEREMEELADMGKAGMWNEEWFTDKNARANGFPDWEAQMDFTRRMEEE